MNANQTEVLMKVMTTLFPVFFMIALGIVSRLRGWITAEQKDGARSLVFGVLFPILIFNAIFTSSLSASTAWIILYVTIAFIAVYLLGTLLCRKGNGRYDHLIPYLLTTCEGGNVALPLYTTIVGAGYAINTVTFDMAGTIIAFILIPILVSAKTSENMDAKSLFRKTMTNSFVLAALSGIILNLCGVYHLLEQSVFLPLYTDAVSMALAPIGGVILFTIGYDLKVDTAMISSILKAFLMRAAGGLLIIGGFRLLFLSLMADAIFRTAVFLYFMSPTGFALPTQLSPLCKDESDSAFMSSFISIYILLTLAVYIAIVITY